jgi:tetrahydromethanopterin S-methyltransferase subunit E
MKPILIVIILVAACGLIVFVRTGDSFPLVHSFPLLGGGKPGIYHVAGIIMALMTINALRKLSRHGREKNGGYTWDEEVDDDDQSA